MRSHRRPDLPLAPRPRLRQHAGRRVLAAVRVAGVLLGAAACSRTAEQPITGAEVASTAELVRAAARPITGAATDYDALLARIGDARVVLLGENTHGTHEFYRERARLTERLVRERGFTAVAIEGDWPETHRVNEFVRGRGTDATAEQALSGFRRFPTWMWANTDVRDLAATLRTYNAGQPAANDVGVYGLDVYALGTAIASVERYLAAVDPAAGERVRAQYACFARTGGDAQRYGAAVGTGGGQSCQRAAESVVDTLRQRAAARPADEALFAALQSARSVANAEAYYRTLYQGGESTWNLRDRAMSETLQALEAHLTAVNGRPARIVVWAHNTHVGDARQTASGAQGELNLGQLTRERLGAAAFNVGFFTHGGRVFAAPDWDQPGRAYDLRPALPGSVSAVLHAAATGGGPRDFFLLLRDGGVVAESLATERLQRAVGVVYRPDTERQSHYFGARLARQFDAVVFFDRSTPVQPLSR